MGESENLNQSEQSYELEKEACSLAEIFGNFKSSKAPNYAENVEKINAEAENLVDVRCRGF